MTPWHLLTRCLPQSMGPSHGWCCGRGTICPWELLLSKQTRPRSATSSSCTAYMGICWGSRQPDHGLRAYVAFVLSSTQPLRVHNPVYRALRHVWTSDSEGAELCRKLMKAWRSLLSPQHPRSTSLNAATTADMAAASAYSTAIHGNTCTIS